MPAPDNLPDRQRWPNLKAIGVASSITIRDGKECVELRYYILSKRLTAKRFAEAVRTHWRVENNLHWQLDVSFHEDRCRIRKGHADANFSGLRRIALSLLKNETSAKIGIKNKRLCAGWDEQYLEKVLLGKWLVQSPWIRSARRTRPFWPKNGASQQSAADMLPGSCPSPPETVW